MHGMSTGPVLDPAVVARKVAAMSLGRVQAREARSRRRPDFLLGYYGSEALARGGGGGCSYLGCTVRAALISVRCCTISAASCASSAARSTFNVLKYTGRVSRRDASFVKRSGDRPRPCAKPTSYITFSLSAVMSTITAAASSIAPAKVE